MKISRHVIQALCVLGLWLGWGLQAHAQTDTVTYVYTDPQGTPLAEADAQGNVIARYDYTPYGNAVTSLGSTPNGPGYTGHVNDPETGLVYMQARYYQPSGRFVSPDPMGPSPGNIHSFNRYAYANNNPVINTDPTGMLSNDMDEVRMGGWGGWQNKTFWRDDHCSVCLQAGSGSAQVTNMSQVNVSPSVSGGDGSSRKKSSVFDAIMMTVFGTRYAITKRPDNPTYVPWKLSHQVFMTTGTISATALGAEATVGMMEPSMMLAGHATSEAAYQMYGMGLRVAPRFTMMGCLGLSTCYGNFNPQQFDLPDQVLYDKEVGPSLLNDVEALNSVYSTPAVVH